MNITWYGHRCIRIESKEGSILVDPFDPKEIGLRGPTIKDDLVLVSDPAPSKAILERINEDAFLVRGPGEYERKGIAVLGIQGFADSQSGAELGLCTIYRIVAEDLSICHLGGIGQDKLTPEQLEAIGDPDILIIPVGGQSALDAKAAAALANEIEPKIIIPIQFAISSASYKADAAEKFIKEIGLSPQKMDKLRISKKQMPVEQTDLIVLEA
jgi:L-ascorbate metabolism protein UlaG (beta-lactamase superfamily)